MAYRRRNSAWRSSTYEDLRSFAADETCDTPKRAIRASALDSSPVSSSSSFPSTPASPVFQVNRDRRSYHKQSSNIYEYSSRQASQCSRSRFWDILAQKTKAILDDDNNGQQPENHDSNKSHMLNSADDQTESKWSAERYWKADNTPVLPPKEAATFLNPNGTIKNDLKEGISTMVENGIDTIPQTNKLEIRRLSDNTDETKQASQLADMFSSIDLAHYRAEYEAQLKSSKKVANSIAAKAKLLLRELKTVKADLVFSKQRCTQLEEENKALRENRHKGNNHADDDLIRHQIETLLAEKGRLAHENTVYARENRFLGEIVEYHQLTMQDDVYLDDAIEEDSEVYPIQEMATTLPVLSVDEVSSTFPSTTDSAAPRLWELSMDSEGSPEPAISASQTIINNVEKAPKENKVSLPQSPKAAEG